MSRKQRISTRKEENDIAHQTRLAEEKQMKEDEEFNNKKDGNLPSRITDLFNLFSSGKSKEEVHQPSTKPLPINKRGQLPHEEELRIEARKEKAEMLWKERTKRGNNTTSGSKKSLFGLFN